MNKRHLYCVLACVASFLGGYLIKGIYIPRSRGDATVGLHSYPPTSALNIEELKQINDAIDSWRMKNSESLRMDSCVSAIPARGMAVELRYANLEEDQTEEICSIVSKNLEAIADAKNAEQVGADQPATAPQLKSEGSQNPQPESEVRPQ